MKVRELIEDLKKLDQSKDILIEGYEIKKVTVCTDCDGEIFYVIEDSFY